MLIFYALSPLPTIFSRRFSDDLNTSSALKEFCFFLTTGIVLSAFALPILLSRAPTGKPDEQGNYQSVVSTWRTSINLKGR